MSLALQILTHKPNANKQLVHPLLDCLGEIGYMPDDKAKFCQKGVDDKGDFWRRFDAELKRGRGNALDFIARTAEPLGIYGPPAQDLTWFDQFRRIIRRAWQNRRKLVPAVRRAIASLMS